jgi:acyl carrier protein
MTRGQLREVILYLLHEVAPEVQLQDLSPGENLCDALGLDSFDFLNFIVAVHETLRIDVPANEYSALATLGDCINYLTRAYEGRT